MKALVTGASGFIGSGLVEELSSSGFEPFALMRNSSSDRHLKGLQYTRASGDLSDIESLKKSVAGVDYVFHLAGTTAAPNREEYFKHNAQGTKNLAEAVAAANPRLKRFIYVSSLAASGPAQKLSPKTELDSDQPISAYGESKRQGEIELLRFKDQFPVTIIRPPMVYGPKDRGVFVIFQTVSKKVMPLLRGATPDGHKHYSLIHVQDLVRGIVQSAQTPGVNLPSGEIFYLAGDEIVTYEGLMQIMADHMGLKPFKFFVPPIAMLAAAYGMSALGKITGRNYPLNIDKLNEVRPDYWICSNSKARDQLGFTPQFDLRDGLGQTLGWYKEHQWL